jgi:hypothetical protein
MTTDAAAVDDDLVARFVAALDARDPEAAGLSKIALGKISELLATTDDQQVLDDLIGRA